MKPPRFLVDENLSVLLPQTAHAREYEATHVNYYGLHQSKDWDILCVVALEDWILVTNNAIELSAGTGWDSPASSRRGSG